MLACYQGQLLRASEGIYGTGLLRVREVERLVTIVDALMDLVEGSRVGARRA
jgi:hypothetical protein